MAKKNTNTLIPEDSPLRDFRNFLYVVWKFLWETGAIQAEKPDPTDVQYDIAHYLQHGPRRKMIMAFRGVGKSWITAAYVCWRLMLNPNHNFLVVSASKDRSDQFSIFTKRLIFEMPLLAPLRPRRGQRDSNIAFDVGPAATSHSPSVKSVGITGQLTGSRADEIIADDVESLNNSLTQMMRDQLEMRVTEFDAIIKPGAKVTYLGTPQTELSMYNNLPGKGYEIRIWPARIPEAPENYRGMLAPMVQDMVEHGASAGTPVDPKRFTSEDLMEREASYGRSGFALQFMLDTTMADAEKFPLKLSDLIVQPLDKDMAPVKFTWSAGPEHRLKDLPAVGLRGDAFYKPMAYTDEMASYTGTVMAIDPSGRGEDETAYAIVKILYGQLYLVDSGGFAGGYDEFTLRSLANKALEHGVNEVILESNFGDGMFTELFKPILNSVHPCTVEEVRSTSQKELRIIETLEPVLNQHRLVVDPRVIQKDFDETRDTPYRSLFYQMTRLTKDKGSLRKDDRLDALEMAVKYWLKAMALDQNKAHDKHREKLMKEELKGFMKQVVGQKVKRKSWIKQR